MARYPARILMIMACVVGAVFFSKMAVAQSEAEARAADSQKISQMDYEDLQQVIPEYMEMHGPDSWGTIDDITIAGLEYTLVFLRGDDGGRPWADVKDNLPDTIYQEPAILPTDEQIFEYIRQLAFVAGQNFQLKSEEAFAEHQERFAEIYDSATEEGLKLLVNEGYHTGRNAEIAPEAQELHDQHSALLQLSGALELYLTRFKGKI